MKIKKRTSRKTPKVKPKLTRRLTRQQVATDEWLSIAPIRHCRNKISIEINLKVFSFSICALDHNTIEVGDGESNGVEMKPSHSIPSWLGIPFDYLSQFDYLSHFDYLSRLIAGKIDDWNGNNNSTEVGRFCSIWFISFRFNGGCQTLNRNLLCGII